MTKARAAARPDEIRRHNLGLLLEQVHRDGELSRAELTRRLGLNRSTIGALVADLTELGLLSELVPTRNERAGRPSHRVGPREDGPFAFAVDIEVDRIASAAVGLTGEVLTRRETVLCPDERSAEHVAGVIAEDAEFLIRSAATDAWPVGVGVSIPGTVTRNGREIAVSPNLDWRNLPFASMVGERLVERLSLQLPVELGNDADLGVLAEHLRGAGRGCGDVVYLTGRIGVGAGILVNGVALRGHLGLAGEIGHVVLDPAGPQCHCGNRGCVETYIGQPAVLTAVGRPSPPGTESISWLFESVQPGDSGGVDRHAHDRRAARPDHRESGEPAQPPAGRARRLAGQGARGRQGRDRGVRGQAHLRSLPWVGTARRLRARSGFVADGRGRTRLPGVARQSVHPAVNDACFSNWVRYSSA